MNKGIIQKMVTHILTARSYVFTRILYIYETEQQKGSRDNNKGNSKATCDTFKCTELNEDSI